MPSRPVSNIQRNYGKLCDALSKPASERMAEKSIRSIASTHLSGLTERARSVKASASGHGVHEGCCPLARAWAGVKPSAGAWGWREFPTAKKRLNNCHSSRVIVSRLAFTRWRGERCGLRCLRESAGAVCLVTFAGKTVSVLPGLSCQGERARNKSIMPCSA